MPLSFRPARVAKSPSESVAVTTPVVKAAMVLAWATLMEPETEMDSLPRSLMPEPLAAKAVLMSA